MKIKCIVIICLVVSSLLSKAQVNLQSIDTIKAPAQYDNIFVKPIYTDSSKVSSFVIFIRNEVKAHKHESHTEQVFVLEGMGTMVLGDKTFKIKKGDIVFIPQGTFHSVISTSKKTALKVLSIQAPYFDGKDRIFK